MLKVFNLKYYKKLKKILKYYIKLLSIFNLKFYIKPLQMLGVILFLLFVIQLNINYEYSKKVNKQLVAENDKMKEEILVIGGASLKMTESERLNINELVNRYQQNRALSQYKWRYEEIGYPVIDPKLAYITCEAGYRKINNKWENVNSIDIKQVNTLEVPASISGFARVSKHDVYGYNILIEGLVVMKNELNKPEIKKVKVKVSHLSKIYVNDGQWVNKKDVIALQGNSGRVATWDYRKGYYREVTEYERSFGLGVHLDFEIYIDGILRNPLFTSKEGKTPKL